MKRRHEEHENHERWLVSYADFITLLFAFFTILYASSAANLKKTEELQESIRKSFSGYGGGGGSGNGVSEGDGGAPSRTAASLIEPIMVFPGAGSGAGEIQGYVSKKLEDDMPDDARGTVTSVNHDAVGVRIQMAANKLFSTGSADLQPESAAALEQLGSLLKESKRRIIVEGHTDDQPIHTEKFPSNWELSAARATKIVRYLIARHKIAPSLLTAVAYADQKPVAANDTEENRIKNRRIEIMIVTDAKASR